MMISQLITGIGLLTIAIVAFIYWRKSYFDEERSKFYVIGIGIFFSLVGIYRFLFFYHDFFAPDALGHLLWKISTGFLLISLVILNFIIERYIYRKTKYIITIIGGILIILFIIIVDPNTARIIAQIGSLFLIIFPLLIHCIIAIRGSGWIRKKAIIISIGIIIIIIGTFGMFILEILGVPKRLTLIIGHPLSLLGYIIAGYGFLIDFITK
ncbi:MAG: hypothetical protein EU541_01810 [Promethearchaeota archaeon]|nr:MAG: hypothetical protein EU541_01810 [Candidatus Lokiarchaeota archaeon]